MPTNTIRFILTLTLIVFSSFSFAVKAKEIQHLNEHQTTTDASHLKTIFLETTHGSGQFETFIVYNQPIDRDQDGVVESLDACPESPKGVMVDATGCDIDFDRDGVENNFDACPNTQNGHKVNEVGC